MDDITPQQRKSLCEGAQDEVGAVCDGPNVTNYLARDVDGSLFHARWCDDCATLALRNKHRLYKEVTT